MQSRERKYLDFMGAYWSIAPADFEKIQQRYDEEEVIDFTGFDVIELKRKPRGPIQKFRIDHLNRNN